MRLTKNKKGISNKQLLDIIKLILIVIFAYIILQALKSRI